MLQRRKSICHTAATFIAGAGSIITKDVPDYAVVVGAPARIIRFRYSPSEIESLNKIAWWDWTDDEIRERSDDFYVTVKISVEIYAPHIITPNISIICDRK